MANFDTIYTGRGFAPRTQVDTGKSAERLSDFIIRAEEIRYNAFKQNEQEFLKSANIDPVFFISQANQDAQVKALNDFNQRWSLKFKEANYNLSPDDKQLMNAEKNALIAKQQKWQTEQDLWQQHRTMVMQNPNKYDLDEWSEFDAEYRRSGEYPLVTPPIRAKSIDMALENNPITTGTPYKETREETRSGLRGFVDIRYSGTEAEGRQRVRDMIFSDDAYIKDVVQQFNNLDEITKLQYLDADKNGLLNKEEMGDFNPILQWAQDTKWQLTIKKDELAWRKTETTTKAPSNFVSLDIGMGTPVKYQPTERQSFRNYTTYHSVPEWPTQNIPTKDVTVWKPNGDKIRLTDKTLSVQLTGYDENTDQFTFITKRNYYANDTMGADDQIAIARTDLPPAFGDFTILVNGQRIQVKDLKRKSLTNEKGFNWGETKNIH